MTTINSCPRQAQTVREALRPYLSYRQLRRLAAADAANVDAALLTSNPPAEVTAALDLLTALLQPSTREQITSAVEVAALLMLDMRSVEQEQLRVICLDTKHHIQTIRTVYQGNVHSATIRVGEVFREAVRRTSAAIILAHNHPSGDPTPSPEDAIMTRQIVEAGHLLDISVLDTSLLGRGAG